MSRAARVQRVANWAVLSIIAYVALLVLLELASYLGPAYREETLASVKQLYTNYRFYDVETEEQMLPPGERPDGG